MTNCDLCGDKITFKSKSLLNQCIKCAVNHSNAKNMTIFDKQHVKTNPMYTKSK